LRLGIYWRIVLLLLKPLNAGADRPHASWNNFIGSADRAMRSPEMCTSRRWRCAVRRAWSTPSGRTDGAVIAAAAGGDVHAVVAAADLGSDHRR
jgi:hypothetical protein